MSRIESTGSSSVLVTSYCTELKRGALMLASVILIVSMANHSCLGLSTWEACVDKSLV